MNSPLDQAARLIETERAQIGHEIHDGLLPLIFAASATLSNALEHGDASEAEATRQKLKQVQTWLADALHVGRRLLNEVYPPELHGNSWTYAAKDTLERLFPEDHDAIRWQTDSSVDETTDPIAFAAYRIVVEAVRNAIGHGKATEVRIEGSKDGDVIHVRIRDNGTGFDPTQVAEDRFGIRAMYGRAELVEGSLAIHSDLGGPTTVSFSAAG